MADYQLNVQDTASVEAWKDRVNALNQRADQAIREAADALREFKDTAEGNVFEEVCKYGEGVVTGMTKVLEGMNEILTAVNKIMETVKSKAQELVSGVVDVIGKVLG